MFGFGKPARPKAVAFDIIGTTFPLEPLRVGITEMGLPPAALEGWFAAALRDAFALAAVGDFKPFATVLEEALGQVLAEQHVSATSARRKELVAQMQQLPSRIDAKETFVALHAAGIQVLALSNGSTATTRSLLKGAGLEDLVAHVVSVDDVKFSKPRREVYDHAASVAGVEKGELMLVAKHGWDINGAKAAGLTTAYLSADAPFPSTMRAPDLEAPSLGELARTIAAF